MRSFSIQFSQLEVSALKKLTGVKLKISNSQIYQVLNLDGRLETGNLHGALGGRRTGLAQPQDDCVVRERKRISRQCA